MKERRSSLGRALDQRRQWYVSGDHISLTKRLQFLLLSPEPAQRRAKNPATQRRQCRTSNIQTL